MLKKISHSINGYVFASLLAVGLFLVDRFYYHTHDYYYLLWNLFLAWIPFVLSIYLVQILKRKAWSSYEAMIFSLLWLLFIPNCFYLLSDFIHLNDFSGSNLLFNITYFSETIFTGLFLGFKSVSLIGNEIKKRYKDYWSNLIVLIVFLISSFGVYVGRVLRWNSWDIFIDPGPLFLDIYHHLTSFKSYPVMLSVVISFFLLISSIYYLVQSFNKKIS